MVRWFIALLLCLSITLPAYATVELDLDNNQAIDVSRGGTNSTTAAGAKTNIGLGNVDNTSDLNKPISILTQSALDGKQDLLPSITSVTTEQELIDAEANVGVTAISVIESFALTQNVTVTKALAIVPGAVITTTGYTLTMPPSFTAGAYQVFVSAVGEVNGLKWAIPEWFAVNTTPGTTDLTDAIQSAVDAVSGTGEVILAGTYGVTNIELLNKSGLTIRGNGMLKSLDGTETTVHLTGCQDVVLKDFTIYGTFATEGPVGMAVSIRVDPNIAGATQVNRNISIDNLTFKHNPLNAIFLAGDGTTYGDLSNVRITNSRMEYGLCFLLAVGVKNVTVDNINILHTAATPVNAGLAQDEDIAFFSDNTVSCENITVSNISIQANGTVSNIYTGRPKFSFGISDSGLAFTNLLVRNISVADNLGNFIPSYGTTGATMYVTDANAARTGFHNAQFQGVNFYNSPGIFIEANNLQFSNVSLDTFPSIAAFAGFGRAIDSAASVSTSGCKLNNVLIKNWNAGNPVIYTAEGGVEFNGLHIIGADGAVWASPNNVYNNLTLDDVGNETHGSFFAQAAFSPFVLNNLTIKNAPYTGLKDNLMSRATGSVISGARFVDNAVDTDVDEDNWMIYGILAAPTYADNAAALIGGLEVGNWYKTAAGAFLVVVPAPL